MRLSSAEEFDGGGFVIFGNVRLLDENFEFRICDVAVQNGVFAEKSDGERIDCSGLTMLPGLVDIHTHGAVGYDNMDASPEAIRAIAGFMAEKGVTTFLPTIMTQSKQALSEAAENIANVRRSGTGGAKIGGIYMEGPYFSVKYKGAQNEEFIRDPDIDEFEEINARSGGIIRIVSIAPERGGSEEFVKRISQKCRISIGHTDADYETARRAIELGASNLTHTYNAMRGLQHRSPNAIGAAIDSGITCECICDGMHVHPAMVRLLYRAVGKERLVLVSDSLRATGMPDGEYELGGQMTYVSDGRAALADGTIAGSTATLFGCVKKAVEFGIPLEDAVRAASLNPARAAGISGECGVIKTGRAADFILTDDELNLRTVYADGVKIK